MTLLVDRFRFLARGERRDKTPIRAEAPAVKDGGGGVAALRLYDPIDSWGGQWGVSAKEFVSILDELDTGTSEIRVYINSPGGEVWEGIAILNALRAHPARVVAVVEGVAASAASFIAAGADELVMARNSELFIHNAWGLAIGNADDMAKMGADLAHEDRNLASIYADKSGGTVDEWLAAMAAETWYSTDEAVSAGLADRVEQAPAADVAAAKNRFDLSIFNHHTGRGDDDNPPAAPIPPTASADGSTPTPEGATLVDFNDEQIASLREQVGFPEDADAATITAAVAEALTEHADPALATNDAVPSGHVVVPEARLSDLEAAARQGVEAAQKLNAKERDEFLDANRSKFAPANRAAWANEYDRDPAGTRKHFEAAPVIVPVDSIGHDADGGDTEPDVRESAVYKNWSLS